MPTDTLRVPTPDGEAHANLFTPDGAGPWPLVVFYMDAMGLRPAMSEMAGRLVAAGYAVLQPELYWRSGPYAPFHAATTFSDPPERDRVRALMNAVQPQQVIDDTNAFLAALGGDPRWDGGRIGLLGYCMGGRMALFVAAALGARVAASASVHGGGLVRPGPDSPHRGGPHIKGRLYFGVADNDNSCTAADCAVLGEALQAAGARHDIELFAGALHGFAVPDFSVYDAAAAERHWERVLSLFGDELG
jgi:carboxymethylenebutenolidase